MPRGNHTHTYLHYFSSQRAIAQSGGIRIVGKLEADTDVKAKEIFEIKPNSTSARRAFFGRYNPNDFAFIQVDKTDGALNWGAYFQFKENGELQTSLGLTVTSGGDKTWDLIQSGNEFNFAGNGLTSTSCVINCRRAGSGAGTSQIEDYYFCEGYSDSTTTQLADVNVKDLNYYGGINNLSDERLKRNIILLEEGARALIKQLSPK